MRKSLILVICVLIILCGINFSACSKNNISKTVYDLDIDFDVANMTATVSENVTYTNNTGNKLDNIAFHLYPNAFSDDAENPPVSSRLVESAYYDGMSYGNIDILRVEENNESLTFTEDKEMLYVTIPTLSDGDEITIFIRYSLTLPAVNHRFGYNENSINLANFYPVVAVYENSEFRNDNYYPIGDPFYSEVADYNVKLKVDKDYVVSATGKADMETANVDTKVINYKAENVRDFAMVMSDKYQIKSGEADEVMVNYYYYNDPNPEQSLNAAVSAIILFNDIIGDYPYDTFSVCETELVYGGMEYPELVMISSNLTADDRDQVIVHETAHQWWYGLVGNDSINSAWMDEGLTEFVTALYYAENGQENIMKEIVNNSFNSYLLFNDVRLTVQINADTTMTRGLGEFTTEYEYVTMVYSKGLLMFNTIYEIEGRDEFVKSMQRYYRKYCYANATEQQLIDEFNRGNKAVSKVFDAWLNGKVILTTI